MDIERPDLARVRRKKRWLFGGIGGGAVALAAVAIAALKPALPAVERGNAWIDQVKRGTLVRQVRGSGTLVPVEVNWISAAADARVEKIVVQPGSVVSADTVVLELADAAQLQRDLDARFQLIAAEADYASLKNRLESEQLDQQAAAAKLKAEAEQARLRADADDEMARQGILGDLPRRLSTKAAEELANRHKVQLERLRINERSIQTQLAA